MDVLRTGKSINDLAVECILGKWGNGSERERNLKKKGYDYNAVQARINEIYKCVQSGRPKYRPLF